jgi:hypothetical protein
LKVRENRCLLKLLIIQSIHHWELIDHLLLEDLLISIQEDHSQIETTKVQWIDQYHFHQSQPRSILEERSLILTITISKHTTRMFSSRNGSICLYMRGSCSGLSKRKRNSKRLRQTGKFPNLEIILSDLKWLANSLM